MNLSFYTGAVGAISQQDRLDIIANNIANINTEGYKSRSSVFAGLIYSNMNAPAGASSNLKTGVGVKVEKTDLDMRPGAYVQTDGQYDFAIVGEGLFALRAPKDNLTYYTRNGSFMLSKQEDGKFYLASKDGYLVLGKDEQPIEVNNEFLTQEPPSTTTQSASRQTQAQPQSAALEERIAVYRFRNYNDFESVGGNRLLPRDKNGQPILREDAQLNKGMVESANVDFANEVSKMIETQRAYQFALRMVQTSDEVEATINSLRG